MSDAGSDRAPGLRVLLGHARTQRSALLGAAALGLVGGAAGLAQPLAAREVIERLAGDASLAGPLAVLAALVLAGAACTAASLWLAQRAAHRIVLGVRRRLAERLLRLPMRALDRMSPGDLVARATSDTTLLGEVASTAAVQMLNGAVLLVGAVVLMGVVDLVLLGVALAVLVVAGGLVGVLLPRIARATEASQAAVGEFGSALERALGAIRTLRASGAEPHEGRRLGSSARTAYERAVSAAINESIVASAAGVAVQTAFLVVLGIGGARVADGTLAVADLIAFLLYLFYIVEPVASLAQGAARSQAGVAALRRLEDVEVVAPEELGASRPAGAAHGVDREALVRFEGVTFAYAEDRDPVLRDLDIAIPAVGLTALVGPSGAGKTTCFALLERFYDPQAGRISFAGRDVREWPRAALRAQIGYVEQDAPVLAGSLRENLLLAAPEAGDEALAAALRATRLQDLVSRLPDGLDTEVGARGGLLSGGERQRVAIARALLRRPRLLLLDEATSQLDARNEAALRAVVAEAARERAVLAIAHRLSTVVDASHIIVLDAGGLRAQGTHEELVAGDELYRDLAETQLLSASPRPAARGR